MCAAPPLSTDPGARAFVGSIHVLGEGDREGVRRLRAGLRTVVCG